ncbi:hypothetical protein [Pseudobacteriovorax antillogorgiicola]|uniref:Transporter n=1 Tax=Pseudobacteriovorax antillogorgiicola TaxID=1513793 RepID=A0A1Y6BIU1_9BACT|nr:hypothetical protein [Pseudobacteriovorax antillogorgiicola]TCS55367.1 hypothetical protein EDD56_10588 [Pseudobacteriovorax antillogorgiicola]SMF13486.1 hypothetical protein SAMN06296036_105236 [Pseudobacteriovorax antillogorgiicola]
MTIAWLVPLAILLGPVAFTGRSASAQTKKILPPSPPPKIVPPHPTIDDLKKDLKRKRMRRRKREPEKFKKKGAPKPESPIIEMTQETRPGRIHSSVSFMIPYAKTFGEFRDQYIVEPGLLFNLDIRLGDQEDYKKTSFWLGFRMAPMNGSGTYRSQNGRFSFLYWGPSLSLAWIKNSKSTLKKSSDEKDATKNTDDAIQNSWRWSFGIAALSRYGTVSEDLSPGEGELSNEGLTIDIPGVWTELTYGRIYGKTISMDVTVGLQSGEAKLFAYTAIGMGLWY